MKHTFTHFHFEITVLCGELLIVKSEIAKELDARWYHEDEFDALALPTVMKKILKHADFVA